MKRTTTTTKKRSPKAVASPQGAIAGGYDGGNTGSSRRGWVYWPTLDTRKELPTYQRLQILRKVRSFYANVGFTRRIINGLANMVGYLQPQAATRDRAWNALAEAAFDNYCGEAFVFDRAAKYDFYSWQVQNTRLRLKDGDCFTLLTETDSGIASTVMYEAHQVSNGSAADEASLMDGVRLDKFGRHIAYKIVDPADESRFTFVNAENGIFHCDFERPGQVRGVSALAHAVNRLQDIQEITGDWMHAIKLAAQIGFQMTRPGSQVGARGLAGAISAATNGDSPVNVEQLYGSGIIPQLGDGEKIELLHDDRPHPNSIELLYWMTREIAWGVGLSPEVLWDIAKQTGPSTRYLMAETQRWVQHEQAKLERICRRIWVYFIAKEIKGGRLPLPSDPNWWLVNWVPQADLTIDRGRENQADIDNIRIGTITRAEVCAKRGADWENVYRRSCQERAMMDEIAAEYGLDAEDVIPDLAQQSVADAQADQMEQTDPEDPTDPAQKD